MTNTLPMPHGALAQGASTPAAHFNAALREHACAHPDWELREPVAVLYAWAELFTRHFALGISPPALALDGLPGKVFGRYRSRPNGFGVDDEVVINRRTLKRPVARVLCTLLHELLHQWQQHHGVPGPGAHNLQFRRKCLELGIPCDERGCTLEIVGNGPFAELLRACGIAVPAQGVSWPAFIAGSSRTPQQKQRAWRCGCTEVRCAGELQALCERCGQRFELAKG